MREIFLDHKFDFLFIQGFSHLQVNTDIVFNRLTDEGHGVIFTDLLKTGFPVLKMMENSPHHRQFTIRHLGTQVSDLSFNTFPPGPFYQDRVDVETPQSGRPKNVPQYQSYSPIATSQVIQVPIQKSWRQIFFQHFNLASDVRSDAEISAEKSVIDFLNIVMDKRPPCSTLCSAQ